MGKTNLYIVSFPMLMNKTLKDANPLARDLHTLPKQGLTACPLSNYAIHNFSKSALGEGLASSLFKEIWANRPLLEMDGKPCALLAHPEEVEVLAKSVSAYRTHK